MKIIPSESFFEIKTALSKEAVMEIIKKNVTERHPMNLSPIPPTMPFKGGVYDLEFEVKESVWFWQVYAPVFCGVVETSEGSTILRIRASNTYTVLQIAGCWVGSIAAFFIGVRIAMQGSQVFSGAAAMLLGLFGAAGLLYWTSWYYQKVEDGKKRLLSLFVVKPK
jgi:hypothetical protein